MTDRSTDFKDLFLVCAVMVAIFITDAVTSLDIAVAVLYILVIMIAMRNFSAYGIKVLSLTCACLTLIAFFISHNNFLCTAFARCLVSLIAIAIAGGLAIKTNKFSDELQAHLKLLAQTHDAIIICALDGSISSWNLGAQALYGWNEDEVKERNCWDLLNTRSSLPLQAIKDELLINGCWEGELTEITRMGKEVIILSRWSLYKDHCDRPQAILASNNDITDVRRAEEELHRSQTELAHVSRLTMLGELGTSIAHEVNQPLATIITNADAALRWLRQTKPDLNEVQVSIEQVSSNARRASEVIHRIRAWTRKSVPKYDLLDIEVVLTESLMLLNREIYRHRINVNRVLEGLPLYVLGDSVQLQQVIINLIMNSIQSIESGNSNVREIHVRTRQLDKNIVVEIEDSGTGIDEEDQSVLFDAFFTTKENGMGIGLCICRSIIEAHNGKIWAEGKEGQGAKLCFILPTLK
ncbi:ATP-binding protein [Pseudomonas sp. HN11]|uniref:PAS domain-containing sensor histidine kinase n=1 Tax=Pseudomonas sp. HN11 TaxID=1344094 RepID=UPI001F40EE33|nr:ATP-binding protein [Pseudomonas sp. HN11]UII69633.1 ATP-binding protein [Pseudomonas sp. HN11]